MPSIVSVQPAGWHQSVDHLGFSPGRFPCRAFAKLLSSLRLTFRCFAKSLSCPDEAEGVAREVCEAGGLQPNATTHNLLATMRLRYEQLCG